MEKKLRICDKCGKTIEEDFYKLIIEERTERNSFLERLINADICKDCIGTVLEFLQEKKK